MTGAADRTFESVVFDWDGTAVPDRGADASAARALVESLCAAGLHLFVVSGTHVGNVDGQLRARPPGPGSLRLALNRGSEVFVVTEDGPVLEWRRTATADEEDALDRAADLTVRRLAEAGLTARIVSQRLNRRKIDVIPDPAWADPPKAGIAELLDAVTARLASAGLEGLAEVVAVAQKAAVDVGLSDARVTSDVKHVEIGLTDKSDSARWAAAWLAERGIGSGLVLVAGDEFGPLGGVPGSDSLLLVPELGRATAVSVGVEPNGVPDGVVHLRGGPDRFLELLDDQCARRRHRRVPSVDEDPAWVLAVPEDPAMERAAEAMATLANGRAGVRGSREEDGSSTRPLFVVSGVYDNGANPHLLPAPEWTELVVRGEAARQDHRLLDMRTGVLLREAGGIRTMRLVSLDRPDVCALRAEGPPSQLGSGSPLRAPDGVPFEEVDDELGAHVARTHAARGEAAITVAARDVEATFDGRRMVERVATWAVGSRMPRREEDGFDRLLAGHREAWARRWADADAVIDGNEADQAAARFALFHLLSSAAADGEAGVGPRGLTGPAYGGHVFWDSDVFVLPALAAVLPGAARAMLEYRVRRLPAARAAAKAVGRAGARFPWESAAEGVDVTPRLVRGPYGDLIPIRTGDHEEHITADVAWAAWEYARWTGDQAFLAGPGRDLVIEAARYWASMARPDGAGKAHVYGVVGPDEYHAVVDDNAFTNVMARWCLRRAAELAERSAGASSEEEPAAWRALADALVDGYDEGTGVYEQFAGFHRLEPLVIAELAPTPVAADVLLGSKRVAASQVVKQADVLMLHHLVPEETAPGSLAPNLAFYEPRTAHGSSLSPAIHAALLARLGETARAVEMFRIAARLDLDDITGTTAGGLHLATMGGVWQALAYGFLGLRPADDALCIDPRLPHDWAGLSMRVRFHGARVRVAADHERVTVSCDRPVEVRVGAGPSQTCAPPETTIAVEGGTAP